jgi:Protein of unknown function (DUF3489)
VERDDEDVVQIAPRARRSQANCTRIRPQRKKHPDDRASGARARGGASIATVMRSTGWQPHTVRGFLAAVVRKKLGLNLASEKTDAGRVYRIVADSVEEAGA